jgi:hypothetical protein
LNPHVYWHILYKFGSVCGLPDLSLSKRLSGNSRGPEVLLLRLAFYVKQTLDIKPLGQKVLDS